eukprot:CAMPEP_0181137154 /NCGR_PEP_ID=MMETSP1071-20121207/33561_1 /TAXON_ID=35127 /ORGANISM="Thalassiosira sp., Strain NH16" /LENGTH=58 /DNA_ID=CAMNT_0023223903 /DNA_START=299 /DNA_END=472 /DNA_ORIENTATION=+
MYSNARFSTGCRGIAAVKAWKNRLIAAAVDIFLLKLQLPYGIGGIRREAQIFEFHRLD